MSTPDEKDGTPGTGSTYQVFNIHHVEQLNPTAKTVINNYYGTGKAEKQEVALPRLLECVEKVRGFFWGESSMAVCSATVVQESL